MSGLSSTVAAEFFALCDWAHTVWSMHRAFQEDPRTTKAGELGHAHFLNTLSLITQEYVLLQIAKLHDPACQQSRINLTISYVLEYGGWDDPTRQRLNALAGELETLYVRIRPARNRLISHNDLATILDTEPLGRFPAGLDEAYFAALEKFVIVVQEAVNVPVMSFNHFAATDVAIVLAALSTPVVAEG